MTSVRREARLDLEIDNPGSRTLTATLSGERLSGPATSHAAAYGPLVLSLAPGEHRSVEPAALAPGVWLHRVSVAETGQRQARTSLVVADAESPNSIDWTLYASVLSVTRGDDAGNGICDTACTLREALTAATDREAPALVQFDHAAFPDGIARIQLEQGPALVVRARALHIDGTDLEGNPSPLADFGDRVFPTVLSLRAPNAGAQVASTCPCNESAASLRIAAENVEVRGLAVERELAAEGTICCGDQDLIAFDAGSRGSRLDTARLDGGARAITSAEVASGTTGPATGKDCIDASGTGATSDTAVVVENSEIRFCHDRGAKSQSGWLRLRRNWIHHNLRGGLFAQSPVSGSAEGVIDARDNLLEENGLNCPTGEVGACGPAQSVTRGGASEISAQGPLTRALSTGNVVRDGAAQGIYFEEGSAGAVLDSYVCGINHSAGGKGILSQRTTGAAGDVLIRGTAVVYNDDAGVKLRGKVAADLGSAASPGVNAFTENGAGTRRNAVNALDAPVPVVAGRGNSWENCYGPQSSADACDALTICDLDTNNSLGVNDRIDVGSPLAHLGSAAMRLDAISPAAAVEGEIVRLSGAGFDAISGHSGGVAGDCHALSIGNTCAPLHGTCVEFLVDGRWRAALDVLGVTPTSLVVRAPATCSETTVVRVRRLTASGGEIVSPSLPFCTSR